MITTKEASQKSGYSALYIREWIAECQKSGRDHPFGSMVRFPGSSRRTFKINEKAFYKWLDGEK